MENIYFKEIKNIKIIDKEILSKDPRKSIIFIDIDNTLLRTETDIGSDEWIKWQLQLLDEHNGEHKHCIIKEKLDIFDYYHKWLLKANYNIGLVEDDMPNIFNKYISLGYKVVLITARNKCISDVTFEHLQKYYDTNSFYCQNIKLEFGDIIFKNGIYFAAGTNKGLAIKFILSIIKNINGFLPEFIFFIDDSLRECSNVKVTFNNHKKYKMFIFHYTHAEKFQILFDQLDKDNLHTKWLKFISE